MIEHFERMDSPTYSGALGRGRLTTRAYARVGLFGNPSDGYGGKTIALTIANFWAEATIAPSERLCLVPHPLFDPCAYRVLSLRWRWGRVDATHAVDATPRQTRPREGTSRRRTQTVSGRCARSRSTANPSVPATAGPATGTASPQLMGGACRRRRSHLIILKPGTATNLKQPRGCPSAPLLYRSSE